MRKKNKPKIIVILGPTASGKSNLAVKIAKKYNSEIISADSRQVYKGLDIGSGKITKKEMRGVPHHLIDVASPKIIFTVAQYQKLAKKALQKILAKGKLPIICGGTGFYIDALIYDYKLPEVPPNKKLREKLGKLELSELLKILEKIDPQRYKTIDKKNKRRITRAIEISKAIGRTPKLQKKLKNKNYAILKIGIKLPDKELKSKIKKRIEKMIKGRLISEVGKLKNSGLSRQRIYELGFEYKYPALFLQKKISKKEMLAKMFLENCRYAKRQMTWFSSKGGAASSGKKDPKIHWVKNYKESEKLVRDFYK